LSPSKIIYDLDAGFLDDELLARQHEVSYLTFSTALGELPAWL
jgi:hypothetical protein